MKKMITLAMMMVIVATANAMSYSEARNEALFLSDKMAYELNLTDAQYDAVYEINLDYLMSVNVRADVFGPWWERRNADLRLVLSAWQFDRFMELTYFFRPIAWLNGVISFHIYNYYDRSRFFRSHPTVFVSYRGGHNRMPSHFYARLNHNHGHIVNSPHTHHGGLGHTHHGGSDHISGRGGHQGHHDRQGHHGGQTHHSNQGGQSHHGGQTHHGYQGGQSHQGHQGGQTNQGRQGGQGHQGHLGGHRTGGQRQHR